MSAENATRHGKQYDHDRKVHKDRPDVVLYRRDGISDPRQLVLLIGQRSSPLEWAVRSKGIRGRSLTHSESQSAGGACCWSQQLLLQSACQQG